ncbi:MULTISPECIES: pyridoxamine 5'-phosphate oxidase family protein [unclassified Streptomyces]|uniref:pyridoxamine 5'-phosphate oxidase family protein n=1 Tax=unclassified Streptomyces TaxID=2593676 RepID=UPI001F5B123C|nr:TIGR03618 family F420-dependent PPOX class oxidoreductase [Streptomyces sp. HSG2]
MTDEKSPAAPGDAFWRERRLCFLTTLRPDGTPHLTPVGATYDPDEDLVRVITDGRSRKVGHIRSASAAGRPAHVAVGQVDGRHWCTLEGTAVVRDDAASVAEAERRYRERYRQPRVNPDRVVIEISVTRALGTLVPSGW